MEDEKLYSLHDKFKMATAQKFRLKQIPTDVWSIREKLCLASSVLRSGDQNWVSVSRAIKPYGEANRPPDWFSQKNCAIQYSDLLEKVETPKRKRGDRADVETPGNLIVRKLTIERIEELKRLINEEQQRHRKLRQEVDSVRSGSVDEKLEEVWNRIQEEIKLKTIAESTHHKWLQEREARIAAIKNAPRTLGKAKRLYPKQTRLEEVRRNSSQSEQSEQESALDSPLSEPLSIEVEDVSSPQPAASQPDSLSGTTKSSFSSIPISTSVSTHGSQTSSTSPLLTSLLKSPAPTTAISPTTGSLLTSPTPQPKEGTLPTTQASPRASTTPQPFFDPSCALATAAARQLAVATAPSPTPSSVESLFVRGRSQCINQIANIDGHIHPLQGVQSAMSSAPTLSKLLELPPGVPGKLPPLPIIQPEQTVTSTLQSSTASTVTITTATPASALASTNVVSVVTPETTVVKPSDVFPLADSSSSTMPTEDTEQILNDKTSFISHHAIEIKVKLEPSSPITETNEEENEEIEMKPNISIKVEETDILSGNFQEEISEDKSEKLCEKEEREQEEKQIPITKVEPPEIAEDEAKETCTDILSESERIEAETAAEQQEVTTETETEGSPPETTDSETMAESNIEELVLSKEDIIESTNEDGKENLVSELHQLPSVIEEHSEESRNEETVSDEQVSENLVVTEDENIPAEEEKKDIWEKPEIVEKEDSPTSPESVKPLEEEAKVIRKASAKRGRKPKAKPVKHQNAEESDESTRDKKDDDNSNASSILEKDITAKQSDTSSKHEKVKETSPATPKSELLIPQQAECSEQSLIETRRKPTLSVSESIPNSPASTSQSDDQDNAKDYRTWKKAIMLVWNAAANHKFANTFLHPVTDDVAPGYHSIVYRPMDLSAIKKNIETGAIKSTLEFQRDMMLMFQNAVMYNSSDHDVFHMAIEMQKEVMEHIQDFLATQLMVQTADTKVLRGREREREKKSEGDKDDIKRKHSFAPDLEAKSKKRRIRE